MITTSRLAVVGALGVAYFGTVFALLHVLDPATDAVGRAGSEYVLGPYGVLMTSCYLALAVSLVALAIAFARSLGRRVAPGLLLFAAFGLVLSSIFPTDRGVVAVTTTGMIHNFAGLGSFISILIAELSLSRAIRHDARFASSAGVLASLSFVVGASFVVLFFVAGPFASTGLFGAAQRLFLAGALSWLFLAALRLREVGDQGTMRSVSTTV